jgi:hypothetical protein
VSATGTRTRRGDRVRAQRYVTRALAHLSDRQTHDWADRLAERARSAAGA